MSEKTVYALGFFDGVHRGHAALLASCRDMAGALGCKCGVITFSNHPDALVQGAAPGLLSTPADRERLLRHFGMESVIALPFDRALMQTPWDVFFRRLLEEFSASGLVCGQDFRFGRRGEGDGQRLTAACQEAGIPCTVVPQVKIDGVPVSSTHIRDLVEMGRMSQAVRFLGHPYILSGSVVHGRALGRRLDIPTANLMLPKALAIPKFGVYACRCAVGGGWYDAVTNVGTRPTVAGIGITVESWLLDYQGDLYGQEITLEFYQFLRPEQKFPSLEALKLAIRQDGERTREILRDAPLWE